MAVCEDICARRQEYAKAPRNGQTTGLTILGTTIPNGINRRAKLVRLNITPSIAAPSAIRAQPERSPRQSAIAGFNKEKNIDAKIEMRAQYGCGDAAERKQLLALLDRTDDLTQGGLDSETADAQTKRHGDRRVVHLASLGGGATMEDRLLAAITMSHEAYRDGYESDQPTQEAETERSVKSHTEFMLRMAADPLYAKAMDKLIAGNESLQKDYAAYVSYRQSGDANAYRNFVKTEYDSSKDYLRYDAGKNRMYGEEGDSREMRVAAAIYAANNGIQYVDLEGSGLDYQMFDSGYGSGMGLYDPSPSLPLRFSPFNNIMKGAFIAEQQAYQLSDDWFAAQLEGEAIGRGDIAGLLSLSLCSEVQTAENASKILEGVSQTVSSALSAGPMATYLGLAFRHQDFRMPIDKATDTRKGLTPRQLGEDRLISMCDTQNAMKDADIARVMYLKKVATWQELGGRVNQQQVRFDYNADGDIVSFVTGRNRPDLSIPYSVAGLGLRAFHTEWDSRDSMRGALHLLRIESNDPSSVVILNPVGVQKPSYAWWGGQTHTYGGVDSSSGSSWNFMDWSASVAANYGSIALWMNSDVKRRERAPATVGR